MARGRAGDLRRAPPRPPGAEDVGDPEAGTTAAQLQLRLEGGSGGGGEDGLPEGAEPPLLPVQLAGAGEQAEERSSPTPGGAE